MSASKQSILPGRLHGIQEKGLIVSGTAVEI